MIEHDVVARECHLACCDLLFVEAAVIGQAVIGIDNHPVGGGVYRLAKAEPALIVLGITHVHVAISVHEDKIVAIALEVGSEA